MSSFRLVDIIARKRDGMELSAEEIAALVKATVDPHAPAPDYQLAAFLMAAYLRGLNAAETLALTLAMRDSGAKIEIDAGLGFRLDKHSTGGVGDKTTLVLVPLLASAGVPVLKMSGRGLGYSGGTIDKLESIPGFQTERSLDQAQSQVREIGAAIIGQSASLAPADKRLYALRDVTATIESIPLIAASIMSKKLAVSSDAILLDVKVGSGAFMKSLERAKELAKALVAIGTGAGVKTVAALTAMEEPLGYAVGNSLEVAEASATLTGRGRVDERFRELCLLLAARSLVLAGKATDDHNGYVVAEKLLMSGQAAAKFEEIITAQGGDSAVVRNPELLPVSRQVVRVSALEDGFVESIQAETIGRVSVEIGAGRLKKEDSVDPSVGILLNKKRGDAVLAGEALADLYVQDHDAGLPFVDRVRQAFDVSPLEPAPRPIIFGFVG